jgi:nitrous oxidase accessory protein NosD
MKSKCLAIGIILLFLGVTIAPTIAQNTEKSQPSSRGNWLYVGGGGPGNYTRIQDAIDNTIDGDTVFVYSGLYYENARVYHSITLLGQDKNSTIIDGRNFTNAVKIIADSVHLNGFTIQNGGVGVWGSNTVISDAIITLNARGIDIGASEANTVIHDNIILENVYGIEVSGYNTVIRDNIIMENLYGIGDTSGNSYNSTICNNVITENEKSGIYSTGWDTDVAIRNIIINNSITNNPIGLLLESGRQLIELNQIENNEVGLSTIMIGVRISILHNNFINNKVNVKTITANYTLRYETLFYKTKWDGNYWNEWKAKVPRPILCFFRLYTIIEQDYFIITIPLGTYPYIQFDWHPALEPYDIPRMR